MANRDWAVWEEGHSWVVRQTVEHNDLYLQLLKDNMTYLSYSIQLTSTLWHLLLHRNVLTQHDIEQIKVSGDEKDQVIALCEKLEKCEIYKLHGFVWALVNTNQTEVVDTLGFPVLDYLDMDIFTETSVFWCPACEEPYQDVYLLPSCAHHVCHTCVQIALQHVDDKAEICCPVLDQVLCSGDSIDLPQDTNFANFCKLIQGEIGKTQGHDGWDVALPSAEVVERRGQLLEDKRKMYKRILSNKNLGRVRRNAAALKAYIWEEMMAMIKAIKAWGEDHCNHIDQLEKQGLENICWTNLREKALSQLQIFLHAQPSLFSAGDDLENFIDTTPPNLAPNAESLTTTELDDNLLADFVPPPPYEIFSKRAPGSLNRAAALNQGTVNQGTRTGAPVVSASNGASSSVTAYANASNSELAYAGASNSELVHADASNSELAYSGASNSEPVRSDNRPSEYSTSNTSSLDRNASSGNDRSNTLSSDYDNARSNIVYDAQPSVPTTVPTTQSARSDDMSDYTRPVYCSSSVARNSRGVTLMSYTRLSENDAYNIASLDTVQPFTTRSHEGSSNASSTTVIPGVATPQSSTIPQDLSAVLSRTSSSRCDAGPAGVSATGGSVAAGCLGPPPDYSILYAQAPVQQEQPTTAWPVWSWRTPSLSQSITNIAWKSNNHQLLVQAGKKVWKVTPQLDQNHQQELVLGNINHMAASTDGAVLYVYNDNTLLVYEPLRSLPTTWRLEKDGLYCVDIDLHNAYCLLGEGQILCYRRRTGDITTYHLPRPGVYNCIHSNGAGQLIITSSFQHQVFVLDMESEHVHAFPDRAEGGLRSPWGLSTINNGQTLLVLDKDSETINMYSLAGESLGAVNINGPLKDPKYISVLNVSKEQLLMAVSSGFDEVNVYTVFPPTGAN